MKQQNTENRQSFFQEQITSPDYSLEGVLKSIEFGKSTQEYKLCETNVRKTYNKTFEETGSNAEAAIAANEMLVNCLVAIRNNL